MAKERRQSRHEGRSRGAGPAGNANNVSSVAEHLELAANAAEQTEWPRAVQHLITAWRLEKHPAIAERVVAIDRLMAPQSIDCESHKEREAAWHRLCLSLDENAVPVLLATPWPLSTKATLARIVALGRREHSPRISHSLMALYEANASGGPSFARLARAIFRLLIEQRDPIATLMLRTIKKANSAYSEPARKDLASFLNQDLPVMPILDDSSLAALKRMNVGNAARKEETDCLYDAVYANPQEVGPRVILADALLEMGEAYGEFIQLQLGARHQRRASQRARELFHAGGRKWVGGIDLDGASDISFQRGFPYQASTNVARFTSRAWATIEELQIIGRCNFVGSPTLVGLRCLYGLYSDELHKIVLPRPTQLEDMSVHGYFGLERSMPFAPTQLGIDDVEEKEMPFIARQLATWPIGRCVTIMHTSLAASSLETAIRILEAAPQIDTVILTGRAIRIAKSIDWSCVLTRSELILGCESPRAERDVARLVDVVSSTRPAISALAFVSDVAGPVNADVRHELAKLAARWNVPFTNER
jgi:uncharacterized protein (TIGR02996 family)